MSARDDLRAFEAQRTLQRNGNGGPVPASQVPAQAPPPTSATSTSGTPTAAAAAAQELAGLLRLRDVGLSIKGARIVGRGSAASADLYLSDGTTIPFDSLQAFTVPKRLALEVAACTGAPMQVLDMPSALRAVVLLRTLAEHIESSTADDEAIEWGVSYLQTATLVHANLEDQGERWGAFNRLNEPTSRNVVLVNLDGTRFVRTAWLFDHVRHCDASPGGNDRIATRMERVGWGRRGKRGRIKATWKGREVQHSFFEVPAGWENGQVGEE